MWTLIWYCVFREVVTLENYLEYFIQYKANMETFIVVVHQSTRIVAHAAEAAEAINIQVYTHTHTHTHTNSFRFSPKPDQII